MNIKWATKEDTKIIAAIAGRYMKLNPKADKMTVLMDLSACHSNGTPLDLQRLLDADDFNLAHDVAGIARHINRETGKLEGFFLPRMAMPQSALTPTLASD